VETYKGVNRKLFTKGKKMKNIIVVTIMAFITLLFMVSSSEAEIPHLIRFQGKLVDADGEPLNDDRCRITFRIYDADDGGSLVWDETHQEVSVTNGVFTVLLGSIDPDRDPLDLSFDENYWLSMEVERDGEMAPRQQITSAGYAYHAKTAYQAENADRAESADEADVAHSVDPQGQDSGLDADTVDGYDTSTTASATSIPITGRDTYLPDDTVDRTALKTASFEYSFRNDVHYIPVTGGRYCFYPQRKVSQRCTYHTSIGSTGGSNFNYAETDYSTDIYVSSWPGGPTRYFRFLYVTSSGTDDWFWLLTDKNSGEILSVSVASDHPSYGFEGGVEKRPHPFGSNYNSDEREIVLLDKETCALVKQHSKDTGKSIATIINEEYKPNMQREEYQPLHSGKYLWNTKEGKKFEGIPFGEDLKNVVQVKHMIEEIPDYIKVRKLVKLTAQDKQDRETRRQQEEYERQEEEQERQDIIEALKQKLNLTDEEWEFIRR